MLDTSTMFAQVKCPEILTPEELDRYLEHGWFRMGQTIFTTNFLNFKSSFYSAVWLRVGLEKYVPDSREEKLRKRNTSFKIEVKKASVTKEKEILYATYRKTLSFEPSASLHTLLFGKTNYNIYTTYEVTVYDDTKLIACGFFDIGKSAAAGISSFYDPAYKKYSLGRYLIYLKMDYCKKLGLQFFYPGYFVPGYSLFDYKLEIGRSELQYFEMISRTWRSIDQFTREQGPLEIMDSKLKGLQKAFSEFKIETRLFKYEFFDANLIPELDGIELFDFPIFVICFSEMWENLYPIVFDVRDQRYHWTKCRSVWTSNANNATDEIYSSQVLKFEEDIVSSESAEEMIQSLSGRIAEIKKMETDRIGYR
jgi:leucyl-tRNA---protein transferase